MKKLLFVLVLVFAITGCSNTEVKVTSEEKKMLAEEFQNQIKDVEPSIRKSVEIDYIDKVTKTHITINTFGGDFRSDDKCKSYIHKTLIKLSEYEKSYNLLGCIEYYFWDFEGNKILHDYKVEVPTKDNFEDYMVNSEKYIKKNK